jgi:hypothetical protein
MSVWLLEHHQPSPERLLVRAYLPTPHPGGAQKKNKIQPPAQPMIPYIALGGCRTAGDSVELMRKPAVAISHGAGIVKSERREEAERLALR